ncbi:hypothetical protein ABPG75_001794 [Micractinium tetrahymenae]
MEEGSPGGSPLRSPGAQHADEQPPHAADQWDDAEMAEAGGAAYDSPRPASSGQQQQQWSDGEAWNAGGHAGARSPGAVASPGRQLSPGASPQQDEQHEQQDEQPGGQHPMEHDQLDQQQRQHEQQGYDQRDDEPDADATEAAAVAAEQQRRLNELEAQLRQPDAVMEPGIMDRLRDYVMANGHPQAAVEHLTDSYVGYAQMASLVCRWLKMTEEDDAPASTTAGAAAAGGAAAAAVPAAEGARVAGARGQELDEAFYLRQLAKDRFDPAFFATVFTSGGSGAPQWLNGLIAEPEGRSLVYELAGKYKNSLLLNFAIHKILMQPGREKEVAAVGGSLTGYFGVFHRLMAAKLREAAASGDEQALEALTRALKEDACASQHTYVHAQQVLGELARHPHGARFRRMSQELEEHAAALHGPVVWKMRQWFAEPGQPEQHYTVTGLLSDILSSSVTGAPPASEMGKLYRLYWPQEPCQQPPPVAYLRHPRVFEVLLQGLFNPARQLQPEAVQAYSGLLALAAAAVDRRQLPCSGEPAAGAAAGGHGDEQQQQQQQQPDDRGGGGLDLSSVPATRAALESAAELAQRVMQDQKSRPEDMETAAAVLDYPCCAAGECLLRALGAQLTRPEYWQTAYHLLKSPPFLAILALLVPRQPALHGALLRLLGGALGALGNSNHDMAKGFLSIAVQLVSAGRVFEVLRWAEDWKQRADPSLVRHLVFGILEVSAPPYSPDFAGSMLRIMMSAGIRRQRLSTRDWAIKALLDEFSAACAQVQFKPPLSAREAQFLQDIGADRPPGY